VRDASAGYALQADRPAVPEGYKQTEVGVIPEDWLVLTLADLNPFVTSGSRGWAPYYTKFGDLFVRITNMSRGSVRLDLTDSRFVSIPEVSQEGERTSLKSGDVLVSITADIGIISYVDESVPLPAYINQHIALVRLPSEAVSSKFVALFLAFGPGQKRFRAITDQGAKAGINLKTVREVPLTLPPLDEQRAIAAALTDVDALLESLDRLIVKKRHIKQATMQQLLTGETRLPGFEGEWERLALGDIVTFLSGGTPPRSNENYWDGDIPWISATSLRTLFIWRSDSNVTKEAVAVGSKMAPIGSTLLLVRGSALHNEILAGLVTKPVCFNQDVKALVPHSRICGQFLTFVLHGRAEDLLKLVSTAGNTAGVLDTRLLKAFEIQLPSLEEQAAIATVLSDIDAEIQTLGQHRTKTAALKQAMMQELLTGRTRLV